MNEYVIANGELYHYGVKGMKWGVRKSNYITVRQAYKNARAKEIDARKQEIQNSKGKGMTARRAIKNANKAGQAARRQSIKDDRAYNKQIRGKSETKNFGKQISEMKLGKLDKHPTVQRGKKLLGKLLDPETVTKRD